MRNGKGWRGKVLFEMGRGMKGGDKPGSGPEGYCVCSSCGEKVKHVVGNPCNKQKCPKCGTRMTRE